MHSNYFFEMNNGCCAVLFFFIRFYIPFRRTMIYIANTNVHTHLKIYYLRFSSIDVFGTGIFSKHLLKQWQVPANSLYRTKVTNLDYAYHKIQSPLGALKKLNILKCAWICSFPNGIFMVLHYSDVHFEFAINVVSWNIDKWTSKWTKYFAAWK